MRKKEGRSIRSLVNRRRSRRATVYMLAGETCGGKYFLPLLANVSSDGLLLECPSGLEMPRRHDAVVELSLPGVDEIIWARCQLVRESSHGFFRRRALRFVDISPLHRKQLHMYIQRVCGLC
ncbi:MAG: PilZ domain-containing protein [Deltaproteobacteria bacterium]|nr:PilZ domain-containing protein [Deltaproteobacteria bacterium]